MVMIWVHNFLVSLKSVEIHREFSFDIADCVNLYENLDAFNVKQIISNFMTGLLNLASADEIVIID